jgi:excisionase family DNA binding protein
VTPAEALLALCALRPDLPEDAMVTVPLAWLSEALEGSGDTGAPSAAPVARADWTVRELADRFGRRPSTVRAWLESGRIRGYRFANREWRVSAEALREFEQGQRQAVPQTMAPPRGRAKPVDLSSWRRAIG